MYKIEQEIYLYFSRTEMAEMHGGEWSSLAISIFCQPCGARYPRQKANCKSPTVSRSNVSMAGYEMTVRVILGTVLPAAESPSM